MSKNRLLGHPKKQKKQGNQMKLPFLSLLCLGLSLGACDHYSHDLAALERGDSYQTSIMTAAAYHDDVANISPAAGADMEQGIDRSTFSQHLAQQYAHLAMNEQQAYDYRAAKYYTAKATSLREGMMVAPADPAMFDIQDQYLLSELEAARADLTAAMVDYKQPENRATLARAQSHFDCWVDQAEEGKEDTMCQSVFQASMTALRFPDDYSRHYTVLFEPDSDQINAASYDGIANLVSFWKQYSNSNLFDLKITVPASLSSEIADKRAAAIRNILQYNGVSIPVAVQALPVTMQTQGESHDMGQGTGMVKAMQIVISKKTQRNSQAENSYRAEGDI